MDIYHNIIKNKKVLPDHHNEIVIVLAYCDTEEKVKILHKCLLNIKSKGYTIILSCHYPPDETSMNLVDYVLYDPINDLVYKKDYEKYKISMVINIQSSGGIKKYIPPFNHSFAVYKLIQNGLALVQGLFKTIVHVIDYDYYLDEDIFSRHLNDLPSVYDHTGHLGKNKFVSYMWGDNSKTVTSSCFSGHLTTLINLFNKFKTKEQYFEYANHRILEEVLFQILQEDKESFKIYPKLLLSNKNLVGVNELEFSKCQIITHFVDGPYVEILNYPTNDYLVEFKNKDTGDILYSTTIGSNCWSRCNYKYFINWEINIYADGELIYIESLNLKDKNVLISIDSKSLGDTIAWFPYMEEFRLKHSCKVYCSSFHNNLFKPYYPHIEFVEPGQVVHNLNASYLIGWFYANESDIDMYRNPLEVKSQPMQKTASDILGLDYKEMKPIITNKKYNKYSKKVSIGIHSTAQAKYWNNNKGWQEVVDYLIEKKLEVQLLSREKSGYMGNYHPTGITQLEESSLEIVIEEMLHSKFFIGIPSGLSWLAWACGIPTVVISGFSEPYTEPQSLIKVNTEDNKCKGCFNSYRLDASDWNWCPRLKMSRHRIFECSKSIGSNKVIEAIDQL